MSRINVEYDGEFKSRVINPQSGGEIQGCIIVDKEGTKEFSSIDLFLCAIGNCYTQYLHRRLKQKGEDELVGLRVELDRQMDFTDKPTITQVTLNIFVPRPVDENVRKILMDTTYDTPVGRTLNDTIMLTPQFHWADGQVEALPPGALEEGEPPPF